MANALRPIAEPYPEGVAAALARYPQQDGYILTLFRTFANSLRFLQKGVPNLLDRDSPLPLRIREVVILRITANNRCEYEWGVHVTVFSKAAELTPAQVADTCSATVDPALWSGAEARLIGALDELCASGRLADATLTHFEADWSLEQQLEILAVCGAYHTISFVANVAKLPGEAFGARFPG
ncbi:MAG: carboxymuconolactone decarboxylase family protein [Hyphomonadaceae bacterium]|nr:MAG: carboxymuconolactone decarboxylase [Caulobacteraceae bacterium]MBT9446421.1 carboxymuconolactone decarboxylase family protein [Hyphomonadaceae bacterium]TPW05302.1 MAG: carboxymuconolactone decarboxylase [Alphaproteobacteria bacterium]